MKRHICSIICYAIALTGFTQSWDLQDYKFNGLFETDSALFSVVDDSWGISYNNGDSWTFNSLEIEEGFFPVWIGFFDEKYGLIGLRSGTENYVIKTEDGGNNWTIDASGFIPQYWSDELHHISDGTFAITAVQGSSLDVTNDYGLTWDEIEFSNSGYTYLQELNSFENSVYFKTGRNIYKSIDKLENWEIVFNSTSDDIITSNFLNENVGYVITGECCDESNHHLHKTNDGGLNWSKVETNLNGNISALIFNSESHGFVIDNESGWIKESNDGGVTWTKNTPFNTEPYLSLRTNQSAFIFGRDAFRFNPDGSPLGISTSRLPIYPNPAKEVINLDFDYDEYKIHDLSGRLVKSGNNTKHIDISTLPNGEYLLQIINKSNIYSNRIIKY